MINVSEAHELVLSHSIILDGEVSSLSHLNNKILSRDILASRQQPPFDRVAMDGIAIKFDSLKNNNKFKVNGIQKAGTSSLTLEDETLCIEVMTGSVLPLYCDTVIPYEACIESDGYFEVSIPLEVKFKQNIHFKGSDYLKGDVLLKSGTLLNLTSVALIASLGLKEVEVKSFPRIAVISTGDELIEPGLECKPWQIWRSNPFGIKSGLLDIGIPDQNIELFHLPDNKEEIFSRLTKILKNNEILILSGGVSMGKFDFVHTIMNDLKIKTIFHKVTQKPGKPLLFGTGESGKIVFGLPGNPVSALVCLRRYVYESIFMSLGRTSQEIYVELEKDITFKKNFSLFKSVSLKSSKDGKVLASAVDGNGSGDFLSLSLSDGFVELPADKTIYKQGEVYRFYSWNGNKL